MRVSVGEYERVCVCVCTRLQGCRVRIGVGVVGSRRFLVGRVGVRILGAGVGVGVRHQVIKSQESDSMPTDSATLLGCIKK